MSRIEIDRSEYDRLLESKSKSESLERKVASLEEETKNKSVALEEARKKSKEKQDEMKKQLEEKESAIESMNTALGLGEGESFEDKIGFLKDGNEKYSQILAKQEEERQERIGKYSDFLGEEFMKEKAGLFDGISDDKKEILLKDYADSKGFGKDDDEVKPKVGVHNNGTPPGDKTSDFDKALGSGASAEDLINTLD